MTDIRKVNISEKHKELLQKLVSISEFKYEKEYLESVIEFFYDTGLDPKERTLSTSKELKKTRDTIVSFIRAHETNKLIPIVKQLDGITKSLFKFFEETGATKKDLADFLEIAFKQKISDENEDSPIEKAKMIFNKLQSGIKEEQNGFLIEKELFYDIRQKISEL